MVDLSIAMLVYQRVPKKHGGENQFVRSKRLQKRVIRKKKNFPDDSNHSNIFPWNTVEKTSHHNAIVLPVCRS